MRAFLTFQTASEQLLANLNRPQALNRAIALRERASAAIAEWGKARFENERLVIERLLQQGQLPAAHEKAQAMLGKAKAAGTTAYRGADGDLVLAHAMLGKVLKLVGEAANALENLVEAQQLCEALGERGDRMASRILTGQADCLRALGRLNEAAEKYEERIRRGEKQQDIRGVAVGKVQLATVLIDQGKYKDAIAFYQESRELFEQQNEHEMVAVACHQIGIAYRYTGHYEKAEEAYRRSLEIKTRINNLASQASSLSELGSLYDYLNRLEEAVTFYSQAADIYVALEDLHSEGLVRSNIASSLRKIKRYDEALDEIMMAIECKRPFGHTAEPWKTFSILHKIETETGNTEAAEAAWHQARDAYLAYRQQGGYAQTPGGKFADQIFSSVQQGEINKAIQFLTQAAQTEDTPSWLKLSAPNILAVLNGSRDATLANDLALYYDDAAEILFLIDRLR